MPGGTDRCTGRSHVGSGAQPGLRPPALARSFQPVVWQVRGTSGKSGLEVGTCFTLRPHGRGLGQDSFRAS